MLTPPTDSVATLPFRRRLTAMSVFCAIAALALASTFQPVEVRCPITHVPLPCCAPAYLKSVVLW